LNGQGSEDRGQKTAGPLAAGAARLIEQETSCGFPGLL